MIADSHCHAWRRWPYQPAVPDVDSRGSIDALLWEMDRWQVERAMLVCARIDGNDDNNEYGAAAATAHPDRIWMMADVDCSWTSTYHTPGAADRLNAAADTYPIVGFTHYVAEPDGWFTSADGLEFFSVAAERNLIAGLAASPAWQPQIREVAQQFPTLPILCHHLGGMTVGEPTGDLIKSAAVPNILLKFSGFQYASPETDWDFPYDEAQAQFRPIAEAYGPRRLVWGSDFPASRDKLTYRQALEVVRAHCDYFDDEQMSWILGRTLQTVVESRRPVGGRQ